MGWKLARIILFITLLLVAAFAETAAAQNPNNIPSAEEFVAKIKEKNPDAFKVISEPKLINYLNQLRARAQPGGEKIELKVDLFSDTVDPEIAKKMNEELEAKGLTPGVKLTAQDRAEKGLGDKPHKKLPETVLGNVQVGDVTPWPTKDETVASYKKVKEEFNQKNGIAPHERFTKSTIVPLPDIPNCSKESTLRFRFAKFIGTETAVKDLVFVRNEVNASTDEVFGKSAQVFKYTGKSDDPISRGIAALNVRCLPFRMRMSQHVTIQDFGLNALKNYDRNFLGAGDLHPYVMANKERLLR